MTSKRIIALLGIAALVAVVLAAPWKVGDSAMRGRLPRYSLAGAWVVSVPLPEPLEGSFLHLCTLDPQDPTGNRYTLVLKHSQCSPTVLGAFPEPVSQSDSVGLEVKTGRNTYQFTTVGHATKPGDPLLGGVAEMVYFSVMSGTMRMIDGDKGVGEATVAYYVPAQDADFDGLPDEGQEPVLSLGYTYTIKRVPLLP